MPIPNISCHPLLSLTSFPYSIFELANTWKIIRYLKSVRLGGKHFPWQVIYNFPIFLSWVCKGSRMESSFLVDGKHFPSSRKECLHFPVFILPSTLLFSFPLSLSSLNFSCKEQTNEKLIYNRVLLKKMIFSYSKMFSVQPKQT